MGSTRRTCRVESSRVDSSQVEFGLYHLTKNNWSYWHALLQFFLDNNSCGVYVFRATLCIKTTNDAEMGLNMTVTMESIKNDATTSFCMNFFGGIGHVTIHGGPKIGFWEFENCQYLMELRRIQNVCHFWATLYSHMSYVKLAKFLGQPVFSWMLTIASCLAVGLWLGLVLNLVSGWLVAIHTYLYHFPLLLSVFRDSKQV